MNQIHRAIGNPQASVFTVESRWENYDIIRISNELYIVGSEETEGKIRDIGRIVEYNSATVMYDILYVYSTHYLQHTYNSDIQDYLNETDFDSKPIIDLCHKYGLFFIGDDILSNTRHIIPAKIKKEIKEKYNYNTFECCACQLVAFIYWSRNLYFNFLNLLSMYAPQKLEQYNDYFKVEKIDEFITYKSSLIDNWKPSIATFKYELIKEDGFYFQITTSSLFHACFYYFSLLCMGATSIDNFMEKTIYIRKCKNKACQSLFITDQSRKRYCPYCSPQKAWNKKNR